MRQDLGYQLHRAFAAMTATLNHELRSVGIPLTHAQFSILQAAKRSPGLSQTDLACETGKDRGAICRSLTYLEREGWIRREKKSGRVNSVFLTQKANAAQPLLEQAIRMTIEKACAVLQPNEIEDCAEVLEKIGTALGQDTQGVREQLPEKSTK